MFQATGRVAIWAAALAAAVALGVAPQVRAAPEPVEHFTRPAAIDGVVISPSGKHLAVLTFGPNGRRRLGVMNLDPLSEPRVIGGFADADVTSVHWVNENRLVYEAFQSDHTIRQGGAATFAVNHDGSGERKLIAWKATTDDTTGSRIRERVLPYGWSFHSTIDDGGSDIHVYRHTHDNRGEPRGVELARLNTLNAELKKLSYGMPDGTQRWILDAQGEPRMLTAYVDGRTKVYWRKPGGQAWDEVADFDRYTEPGFEPRYVIGANEVIVSARASGDTAGLYRFDPVARRVDPAPLVSIKGFDLRAKGAVDSKTGQLLGLHFSADRPMSVWFDDALQRIQKSVDAALPAGRSNRLYCARCEATEFFVVESSSDRQPGEYFLFDRRRSSIEKIGAARPWIDEARQGRRSFHRITARDGLSMPLYVTHPHGTAADQPVPAIVLVHGGPNIRGGDLRWDEEAQFLASRGYRVLQPEFRGSEGYGFAHFRAGWKQWGRAMQDDLADSVAWAAKQGLIDPTRVCIVGASYGGYAALMGPIASPGVYRCAASFAGVADIGLMYSSNWSDLSEASRRYSMPVLIGDPDKPADRVETVSPLRRVAEIKVPLLVAHGGEDRRVPIEHSRKFIAAARQAGVAVEKVEYLDEGHGFTLAANHTDYYRRLEQFLDTSLRAKASP